MNGRATLTRFAWLSIAAAIVTISLKAGAYLVTGSVGLLSDALESLVNLVAAIIALIALTIAAQPPDEDHSYGHEKAEYFSSGVEGALILIAALSIAFAAVGRILHPQPIEQPELGLTIAVIASLVNLVVAQILIRAGRRYESITLEADAHHLMTDVYTSAGVIVGVALVSLTGWYLLDPLIALAVAGHIVWTGVQLLRRSVAGLMDTSLPAAEREVLDATLAPFRDEGIIFHALRTRQSGARRFVSFHVLVPGTWSVRRGHTLLEQVERDVRKALPNTTVFTHLEPIEDPASFQDTALDRVEETKDQH
ncbi:MULTISPECIES: cation diffusion facilitator family transporter [unclassified Roseiflexus]|jgi:cation diffusion facilitator family transporter|uniref:cation diffusion facilitator family transporter n=1 Tax=unclassified Roseiflexus TaxID=2609473 RepID=UPI0000D806FD|nr:MULTISPECIES: cation diffusion facilitator family transporter [unclassified Roseiflexus]ABQ89878.1 cation diffusion facilitator family transporter [Roseiflexus sp. RS-1]MCL6540648.1 cation diffusion facilitator family transporter [Roseiflexus sp.]